MMECLQDVYEEGISIGLEQGLEREVYQKALETTRNLLSMELPPYESEKMKNSTLSPRKKDKFLQFKANNIYVKLFIGD